MDTKISVYSQPGCMPCVATRNWFNKHGIPFEELDAQQHLSFLRDKLGYSSTPIVVVEQNGEIIKHWSGFRPDNMQQISATLDTPPSPTLNIEPIPL